MLLNARLYRSTARPFKAFPGNIRGDNASTLISAETKTRNAADSNPETPEPAAGPELEIDTSNLKFRKVKSKKKENELEVDRICCDASDVKSDAAVEDSQTPAESPNRETKFRLDDFEQWLETSHSLQVDGKIDACRECRHHDSMLSSCNASDCSEEDKDEKSLPVNLCSEWADDKHSDESGKMVEDCKVECCKSRGSYSSGCHSLTPSSSGVASDSEGSGPEFKKPEAPQQDVFILPDDLDCASLDSWRPVESADDNFQVVQSKKKSKSTFPVERKSNRTDKPSHVYRKEKSLQSKKRDALRHPNSAEILPLEAAGTIPLLPSTSDEQSADSHTCYPTSKCHGSVDRAWREDRWNVVEGEKKMKNGKRGGVGHLVNAQEKIRDCTSHVKSVGSSATSHSNEPKTFEVEEAGTKVGRPDRKSGKCGKPTDGWNEDKRDLGTISFGSGCKDLDTFHSPISKPSRNGRSRPSSSKSTVESQESSAKPVTRGFNLEQAQRFLMRAFDGVDGQFSEDSSPVSLCS